MDFNWTQLIGGGIAGALITAVANHLTKKTEINHQMQGRLVDKNFEKLSNFLIDPRVDEFLKYFDGSKLDSVLRQLDKAIKIEDSIRYQRELLEKIFRNQFLSFNEATRRIHISIEENEMLYRRLAENEQSKIFIQNNIANLYMIKEIFLKEDSVFIESGSTLAYSLIGIIDNLTDIRLKQKHQPLNICTNNVLIYMILLFKEGVSPYLLIGRPTNGYGATFGDPEHSDTCNKTIVNQFLDEHKVTSMLTAASFLDLRYGPHVSSKANHQMKRCLNDYADKHKIKNILVITTEKITNDVGDEKVSEDCKLIFDSNGLDNVTKQKDVLSRAEQSWKDHLSKSNNFLITGSVNATDSEDTIKKLQEIHGIKYFHHKTEKGYLIETTH